MVNWDVEALNEWFGEDAWQNVEVTLLPGETERLLTKSQLAAWFGSGQGERPSYGQHLAAILSGDEIAQIEGLLRRTCLERPVTWHSAMALVSVRRPESDPS